MLCVTAGNSELNYSNLLRSARADCRVCGDAGPFYGLTADLPCMHTHNKMAAGHYTSSLDSKGGYRGRVVTEGLHIHFMITKQPKKCFC